MNRTASDIVSVVGAALMKALRSSSSRDLENSINFEVSRTGRIEALVVFISHLN